MCLASFQNFYAPVIAMCFHSPYLPPPSVSFEHQCLLQLFYAFLTIIIKSVKGKVIYFLSSEIFMLKGTLLKKVHSRSYIAGASSTLGIYSDDEIMDFNLKSDAIMG